MVSGSLSLPSQGFFSPFPHGTGTLSVSREYLALPDGPGGFAQDFTCPALLRVPLCRPSLRARGSHPPRRAFPGRSRSRLTVQHRGPTTPHAPRRTRFGLLPGRSPLLGESLLFSFPAGTKMFQFPALAPRTSVVPTLRRVGCPIRASPDHRPFAPTRGFSQLITPFVASVSQGIHHAPLTTSFFRWIHKVLHFAQPRPDLHARLGANARRPRPRHSLACANMSKIYRRTDAHFGRDTRHEWRITDSNR